MSMPLPVPLRLQVLGEALMDCVAQPDGSLQPYMGGSPFNLARAAALRGAEVSYLNPLSSDTFGQQMRARLGQDGVRVKPQESRLPTSLAVVQITDGQPSYGFYREGIADRDYTAQGVLEHLRRQPPGVLHTGSLLLVPPEHEKVLTILRGAKAMGWILSVDVNLRPRLAADLAAYVRAVQAVAALADWLKASDEDLVVMGFAQVSRAEAPQLAAHFLAQGSSRVALTFGSGGAWLQVDGKIVQADVPTVQVVDTVGAGDTFWGNCLADWMQHPEGAAKRAASTLQLAMRAAALNCTRAGCQPPRQEELLTSH
jgi:fructokinase